MKVLQRHLKGQMLYLTLLICLVGSGGLFSAHADQQALVLRDDGYPVRVAIYSGEGAYCPTYS
jgi:hypothetical protein